MHRLRSSYPECPWEAIFAKDDVPGPFQKDTALNKEYMDHADAFKKAVNIDKPQPSPDEVEANDASGVFSAR